jgi:hypothetical protein
MHPIRFYALLDQIENALQQMRQAEADDDRRQHHDIFEEIHERPPRAVEPLYPSFRTREAPRNDRLIFFCDPTRAEGAYLTASSE